MSGEKLDKKVAVVGGGLFAEFLSRGATPNFHQTGPLVAIYLAKRGYTVDIYEALNDSRKDGHVKGISVNLALSVRGIESLKAVGVEGPVLSQGLPMHTRMVHEHNGNTHLIPYGKKGQHVLAVDRQMLHEHLISVAETYPSVNVHFGHKLTTADLQKGHLTFECLDGNKKDVTADLVLGCDGVYSTLRLQFLRTPGFDYSQTYIGHSYKEMCLPPTADGKHAMELGHLHIWTKGTSVIIALPNQDKTYTCTLYFPTEQYNRLKTKQDVLNFFKAEFPDFLSTMGEDTLLKEFYNNPTEPIVTTKSKPCNIADKALIMGDAARCIVPFNGQGVNMAFEDCLVLDELLEKHKNNVGAAVEEYSRTRPQDEAASADLAMYTYIKTRDLMNSPLYLMKNRVLNFLHWLMPKTFIPMYSMVAFSQIPYHEVLQRSHWQDKVVKRTLISSLLLAGVGGAMATLEMLRPDLKHEVMSYLKMY